MIIYLELSAEESVPISRISISRFEGESDYVDSSSKGLFLIVYREASDTSNNSWRENSYSYRRSFGGPGARYQSSRVHLQLNS